jgi:hypothetical protein
MRPVQNELELHHKDVGTTWNDLNRLRITSERQENDQQVVPRSFRSPSFSSCSYVLNDDDVDDVDEEIIRSREYNSGTIKAKSHPDQRNITRPPTLKDSSNQAQPQAEEQEECQEEATPQKRGIGEAEEPAREEVVSEPGNDKATSSGRPRPNRLQEEITALRCSPAHWAKFEYLTEQVSFPGFEKDGKTILDESQCVRLAASDTTSLELFKERHSQVLEMWEQGRCYSPLGLFYSSVRDNYDPRSEETVTEETELEQVVKRATKMMQHQSQQGDKEASSDGEAAGSGTADGDICSKNKHDDSKETYPMNKASPVRASSTNTTASQFSFRKPEYSRQSRQSYHRKNTPSRSGSHSRNNRSNWQAGARGSYRPSYQPWIGPKLEDEEVASNYTQEEEEFSAEETQVYQPQLAPAQEIDPVVTLERMCNWLGIILRKPDLAPKLAGARLELGKDENGENKATFWLADKTVDLTSFSREDKTLIRMAFSIEVAPHYKLQFAHGIVIVPIE